MKQNKSLKLEGLSGQLSLNDEKITYIKTAWKQYTPFFVN
jgi:outer membrane PBP1 activator LpoA protein